MVTLDVLTDRWARFVCADGPAAAAVLAADGVSAFRLDNGPLVPGVTAEDIEGTRQERRTCSDCLRPCFGPNYGWGRTICHACAADYL